MPNRYRIPTWIRRVNLACGLLAGVSLLLMMAVGAADVIGTNLDLVGVKSAPIPAAFEFMGTMMVVTVFLAMSLGQARRTHIRVEILVTRLPPAVQKLADAVQHVFSAVFFALVAWYGWRMAGHSVSVAEYAPGLINYPIWPARVVLAFGASLMSVQCLLDLAAVFVPRLGDAPAKPSDRDGRPTPPV